MEKYGISFSIKFYANSALDKGWKLKIGSEKKWLKNVTVKDAKDIAPWFEDQIKILFPKNGRAKNLFHLPKVL